MRSLRGTPELVKHTITVVEFAQAVGIGRNKAYELIAEGRVRSIRIGRKVLVPVTEPEAFVAREAGGHR